MFAARLRTVSPLLRSTGARMASTTAPRAPIHQHLTSREWVKKHVPTEAYPLIVAVVAMSTYGIARGVHALYTIPGELRLLPDRYSKAET